MTPCAFGEDAQIPQGEPTDALSPRARCPNAATWTVNATVGTCSASIPACDTHVSLIRERVSALGVRSKAVLRARVARRDPHEAA